MKKGQKKRVWTPEQKLEIVHKHLEEHISVRSLAREYGTDTGMICRWTMEFLDGGDTAFAPKSRPGNKFAALHRSKNLSELERLRLLVAKQEIEIARLKKGYWVEGSGVHYLFPFVDYRVMDFAVSIPRHLYVSNKETRVIYRNAFADLMPESLRRVSYKAMVSLRHIGSRNMDHDAYVINREYIVNKLDPEYWRGILDLEAIARREQPQAPASDEARAFRSDTHMLYRCILIQNTAKLAKDWRTIHDRTDLL